MSDTTPTQTGHTKALAPIALPSSGSRTSSWGLLSHLGQAPSAQAIEAVRQEMWAGFGALGG